MIKRTTTEASKPSPEHGNEINTGGIVYNSIIDSTSNVSIILPVDQRDWDPGQPGQKGEQREVPDGRRLRPVLLPPPEEGGEGGDEEEEEGGVGEVADVPGELGGLPGADLLRAGEAEEDWLGWETQLD